MKAWVNLMLISIGGAFLNLVMLLEAGMKLNQYTTPAWGFLAFYAASALFSLYMKRQGPQSVGVTGHRDILTVNKNGRW